MSTKIFIIGDSNTYGWDPRDMMGGPYSKPWPVFLKEAGFDVAVDAIPGCEIPHFPELVEEEMILIRAEDPDILLMFLGSNDILNMNEPDAKLPIARMKVFVERVKAGSSKNMKTVLMGIPEIRLPGGYADARAEYSLGLKQLATDLDCLFFETPADLPLAYDGVHLTQEGHERLGGAVSAFLQCQTQAM